MDPVSAFSLACGVIQVVDFSLKISSTCRKLYKKGSLSENDVIEGWAEDLRKLCGELNPPVTDGIPLDTLSANEQELLNLTANCSSTAHNLINELEGLKVSGPRKKRKVFKQGFRSIWPPTRILHGDWISWHPRAINRSKDRLFAATAGKRHYLSRCSFRPLISLSP